MPSTSCTSSAPEPRTLTDLFPDHDHHDDDHETLVAEMAGLRPCRARTLSVHGEMDDRGSPVVFRAVVEAVHRAVAHRRDAPADLPADRTEPVLDLTAVTFMNARGVRVLLAGHELPAHRGVNLQVRCGTTRVVLRPLALIGVLTKLTGGSDHAAHERPRAHLRMRAASNWRQLYVARKAPVGLDVALLGRSGERDARRGRRALGMRGASLRWGAGSRPRCSWPASAPTTSEGAPASRAAAA